MSGILEGVRVLDFGVYIAGPYCAALLADLGAEVIRIERPAGGDDRYIMPVSEGGEGALYLHSNRGKKSLTLDITHPESKAITQKLIADSDIVIANFSPGALRYLGLDYDTVKSIREDIILVTVSAFGASGELKDRVGFDGIGQAVSGAIHLTGEPGNPHRSATAYVDFSTALTCAYGALGALIRRNTSGEGSHVQASLVGTALNIMGPILMEHASGRNKREPTGNRAPIAGPSDVFKASDGWFIMQVQGNKMFKRWADLVGRPELVDNPDYATDPLRGLNGEALSRIMADWAANRTVKECLDAIMAAKLPVGPVLTPDQILGGELGLVDTFMDQSTYPGSEHLPIMKSPLTISGHSSATARAPRLSEHTGAVLESLGFDKDQIKEFYEKRII